MSVFSFKGGCGGNNAADNAPDASTTPLLSHETPSMTTPGKSRPERKNLFIRSRDDRQRTLAALIQQSAPHLQDLNLEQQDRFTQAIKTLRTDVKNYQARKSLFELWVAITHTDMAAVLWRYLNVV